MRHKVINIDNKFLYTIWGVGILESPVHNRELCKNVYLSQLHGVLDRIREKADNLMTSAVKRDDDVMDLFELSVKAEAMMIWYSDNETQWNNKMIDIDDMCSFIDEHCEMADHSYEFVKEVADATA